MAIRVWLVAAAATAAIATATIADSAGQLTSKQALVQGGTASSVPRAEQNIGRLIVKLRDDAGNAGTPEAHAGRVRELETVAGLPLEHVRELTGGASLVRLPQAMPLSQARAVAARLAGDPSVQYAEPDILMKKAAVPNEPRYSEWQWTLFAPTSTYTGPSLSNGTQKSARATGGANLPPAWDISTGSNAVVVAVIDTGIVNHPDLNGISTPAPYTPTGRFVAGYDFISSTAESDQGLPANFVANDGNGRDPDPTDPGDWISAAERTTFAAACDDPSVPAGQDIPSSWHGTHVAGIIAATANNSIGIAGVAWNVRIQPIRALGKCGGALSDIAEAIQWAAGASVPGIPDNATPAKVINLSLGGGDCRSNLQYMQDAVNAATSRGAVVVAATGNDASLNVIAPANCTGALGVTAHTINGEKADYANVGTGTAISAPGGGTPTTLGKGLATDDKDWSGYYVWSSVLYGDKDPFSVDSSGRSGAAYAGFTGTSAATPHVAGIAALIKSVLPNATPAQVLGFIQLSARAYPAGSACASGGQIVNQCGAGLLDAAGALNAAVRLAPPVVQSAPQSVAIFEGQSATFSVAAAGAAPLTYQWKRNAVDISGATSATYTTPALSVSDTGTRYSVTVTNPLGSVTSPEATVTVVPASTGGPSSPPTGGGGGGGALPLGQLFLLAALVAARRIRRRE